MKKCDLDPAVLWFQVSWRFVESVINITDLLINSHLYLSPNYLCAQIAPLIFLPPVNTWQIHLGGSCDNLPPSGYFNWSPTENDRLFNPMLIPKYVSVDYLVEL